MVSSILYLNRSRSTSESLLFLAADLMLDLVHQTFLRLLAFFMFVFMDIRSPAAASMVIFIPGTWFAQGSLWYYICIAFLVADVGGFDVWRLNVAGTSALQK